MTDTIRGRKDEHLDLCMNAAVGFQRSTLLEQVELVHDALPELCLDEIDLCQDLLDVRLAAPLVIAAMTGGTERAARINRDLAAAAQATGIAFAFGSQRRQLTSGSTLGFDVRDLAPDTLILGNIGVVQARESPAAALEDMVRAAGADALCVHLNPAMEVIQGNGDRDFRDCLATLQRLVEELPFPVVAKETGCGLSRTVAERVRQVGVRHVDVSGAGGTSWTGVEALRAQGVSAEVGRCFWEWGIPTAASLVQLDGLGLGAIATGGLRNGLDALRALALGARAVGMARPLLQAWDEGGRQGVEARIRRVQAELRTGMLLTGSRDLRALRQKPLLLGTELARWLPREAPLRQRLL